MTALSSVPSATPPLLFWLMIQLLGLVLAASHVPFAAGMPASRDFMGAQILSAIQVAALAMLFPYLLRDWRSALTALITIWPFVLAAGYLSGATRAQMLYSACFVSAWLLALFAWTRVLQTARSRQIGSAIATFITVGAAVIWYLRMEFVTDAIDVPLRALQATPLMAVVSQGNSIAAVGFLAVAIIVAVALRQFLQRM